MDGKDKNFFLRLQTKNLTRIYVFSSFVHDPKMAKQTTIKGNVKLQFQGNDQDKYVGEG